MSRIAGLAVAIAALASLIGALSSTVEAVTWHNIGSTAFTATGGPMTLSRGAVGLACTASSMTGAAPGGSSATNHYVMSGTLVMSPCTLAGQAYNWRCSYSFTGTTQSSGATFAPMTLTCVMRAISSGTAYCHLEGSTPVSYAGPGGSTGGRFTFPASNTLTMTNSISACPFGTGSAGMTEHTITVTNGSPTTLGPVLTRTA